MSVSVAVSLITLHLLYKLFMFTTFSEMRLTFDYDVYPIFQSLITMCISYLWFYCFL